MAVSDSFVLMTHNCNFRSSLLPFSCRFAWLSWRLPHVPLLELGTGLKQFHRFGSSSCKIPAPAPPRSSSLSQPSSVLWHHKSVSPWALLLWWGAVLRPKGFVHMNHGTTSPRCCLRLGTLQSSWQVFFFLFFGWCPVYLYAGGLDPYKLFPPLLYWSLYETS